MISLFQVFYCSIGFLGFVLMLLGIYIAETDNMKRGYTIMLLAIVCLVISSILMGEKGLSVCMAIFAIVMFKQHKLIVAKAAKETKKDYDKK